MKTLENLILGDWGPTMRGIARALGYAAMVPAAIALVFAQWLAFTWRRPLAGVLALVPVQRQKPIVAIVDEFGCSTPAFTAAMVNPDARPNWPALAASDPAIEISDEAVAGIRSVVLGLAGSIEPVAPLPPVLAPGPRRQRRGSKQPQNPA